MQVFVRRAAKLIGALAVVGAATGTQALEFTRVSVSDTGAQGDNRSTHPSVSATGRFVLFRSEASNLAGDDTNGVEDVYLRDLLLGRTERISVPPGGGQFLDVSTVDESAQDGSISADGNFALFTVRSNDPGPCPSRVYLRDRAASTTTCVDVGANGDPNDSVADYAISADGNWIVLGYDISGVYLRNRGSGAITQVAGASTVHQGGRGVSISADGGALVFTEREESFDAAGNWFAHNRLFAFERATGGLTLIDPDLDRTHDVYISGDGNFVAFTKATLVPDPVQGDSNRSDIWVFDRTTGLRDLITQSPQGSPADESSFYPHLSHDGRYMAFDSHVSNLTEPALVPGRGLRVYFFDRQTRKATLVSKILGERVDGANPGISGDGRYVAFRSTASNLVDGDTNEASDTFLWDRLATAGAPISASVAAEPAFLWPPNRRMVNVAVNTRVEGAQGAVSLRLRIEDEYGALSTPDTPWSGGAVSLEAMRHGNDRDGRLYTIVVTATDASGQRAEARTQVVVPHDQRQEQR